MSNDIRSLYLHMFHYHRHRLGFHKKRLSRLPAVAYSPRNPADLDEALRPLQKWKLKLLFWWIFLLRVHRQLLKYTSTVSFFCELSTISTLIYVTLVLTFCIINAPFCTIGTQLWQGQRWRLPLVRDMKPITEAKSAQCMEGEACMTVTVKAPNGIHTGSISTDASRHLAFIYVCW